ETNDELIRHYTFSEADLSLIRQRRGDANRLGAAVQLCLLRGYGEFSITPQGYLPNADQYQAQRTSFGNAYYTSTAELGLRVNQQLYLDTFYDAGNLWAQPRDFDPTRLYRGAGFGASVVTPLGPLGVDLGYGFDRTNALGQKNPGWQVHFKFGQIF
ncbi:MAG: DUF4158 domain-containing protein, partial [Gemmatimonadaceae bacterium]